MRHVDEGTIHAWLDDQITDPAEAARIEAHLQDCAGCRALLLEEQATFDRAQTLLDVTAPAVERPSFDALAAKGRHVPGAGAAPARRRERLVQWSWAASLALAVGLGWMARELTDQDAPQPDPPAAVAEQRSPAAGAVIGNTAPPAPAPAAAPVAPPARAAAPSAPARQSRQVANADAQPGALRGQVSPAAPAEASVAPLSETIALAGPPAMPDAAAARAPAAPLPAAPVAAVATPPSIATSRLEAVTVADGQWRAVPRTEAAARTGMPLYGIDGLEPQYTGLSADGAQVRTLYRLESGQQVELVQQRDVPATRTMADAQSARLPLVPARTGAIAQRQSTTQQPLTIVRGDVRLTLQMSSGAADLAALGLRLRVD